MKQARYVFICLTFLISACATKENAPMKPTAEAPAGATSEAAAKSTLSATIDGAAWQATPAWKNDQNAASATADQGIITIRGTSQGAVAGGGSQPVEVMEITLKSSQPGTYPLRPAFEHLQTATFSIGTDSLQRYFIHEKQSGQLVISQSDGQHVSGTFSFDASNTQGKEVHVTNGAFDVVIRQ
jgi:hypothetical protein